MIGLVGAIQLPQRHHDHAAARGELSLRRRVDVNEKIVGHAQPHARRCLAFHVASPENS